MNAQISLLSVLVALGIFASSLSRLTVPSSPATPPGNVIFFETMEDGSPFSDVHNIETGKWDYALQYVTDPFFRGSRSARFEIREDQPLVKGGKRSEVTIIKGLPSREMWYAFAVFFPSRGFEKDSEREVISQWYQNGTPATSLRVKDDIMLLESGSTKSNRVRINIAPLVKDRWHELVFHFIHSYDTDGLIEVWLNGDKVVTHKGGNMYNDVLPKWKIGLYKAAFKYGTSAVSRRIIFFDNVKVGNQHATYADMIPSVY